MSARATALLPAYAAAGFIQKTLDSLSEQTCRDFAVIVSVDVCEDDTYAICEAHARRDPRFTVFRQTQRQGYVGNCNFLLQQADSEYVCFAFHDDLLLPTYVERLCAALDEHPQASLAYSDMFVTDDCTGTRNFHSYVALENQSNAVLRGLDFMQRTINWWVPNRGVFRLEIARRMGGMRTHGAGCIWPDLPWLFHMLLRGAFVRVPEALCLKYYQAGSLSKTWRKPSDAQKHAALAACWREIWYSDIALPQKIRLALALKRLVLARFQHLLTLRSAGGKAVSKAHAD